MAQQFPAHKDTPSEGDPLPLSILGQFATTYHRAMYNIPSHHQSIPL
ncbi:MAG: hypothetical protein KDJ50_05520 [Alphaproteobacteria bacterium]|nr:hypothetical protein [Alphaproteobacteria bacterium]